MSGGAATPPTPVLLLRKIGRRFGVDPAVDALVAHIEVHVDDFEEPVNQNRGGAGWTEAVEQVEAREAEGDGHGEEADE